VDHRYIEENKHLTLVRNTNDLAKYANNLQMRNQMLLHDAVRVRTHFAVQIRNDYVDLAKFAALLTSASLSKSSGERAFPVL
jgi:hypothetical protein